MIPPDMKGRRQASDRIWTTLQTEQQKAPPGWTLQRELGEGSFGGAYLARRDKDGLQGVVKLFGFLAPQSVIDAERRACDGILNPVEGTVARKFVAGCIEAHDRAVVLEYGGEQLGATGPVSSWEEQEPYKAARRTEEQQARDARQVTLQVAMVLQELAGFAAAEDADRSRKVVAHIRRHPEGAAS